MSFLIEIEKIPKVPNNEHNKGFIQSVYNCLNKIHFCISLFVTIDDDYNIQKFTMRLINVTLLE